MSVAIDLRLEGDGALGEYADKEILHAGNDAAPLVIAGLEGGMGSGRASLVIVFVETSVRLFLAAADAIRARFGNQS